MATGHQPFKEMNPVLRRCAGYQSRQTYYPIIKRYYSGSENTHELLHYTEGKIEDQKVKWLAQGHAARKESHCSSSIVWHYTTPQGWLLSPPHPPGTWVRGLWGEWFWGDEGQEQDYWYKSHQNLIGPSTSYKLQFVRWSHELDRKGLPWSHFGLWGISWLRLSTVQLQDPKERRHGSGCHLPTHLLCPTAVLGWGCQFSLRMNEETPGTVAKPCRCRAWHLSRPTCWLSRGSHWIPLNLSFLLCKNMAGTHALP